MDGFQEATICDCSGRCCTCSATSDGSTAAAVSMPCFFWYATLHFTRSVAIELAAHGITVNAICPGFFPSKMTAGLLKNLGEENMAAHAPLRRLGDDEDLKGLALLYASDAGKHITGQWLAVDGGVSCISGG